MSEKWLVLEEGLHPTRLIWIKIALRENEIEHRVDETEENISVLIPKTEINERALELVESLVRAYELTLEAAKRRKITITPYKPLERHRAFAAALRALRYAEGGDIEQMMAALFHEFVWAQPLPNANHRSALLLVSGLATENGLLVPYKEKIIEIGNSFAAKSKPLISEKEFLPNPAQEKEKHRAAASKAVAELLGNAQS